MSPREFDAMLKMGKTGEGIIAHWLRSRGFHVLPVYEIQERKYKGPALYSIDGPFIAPDLLAFQSTGKTLWVEAKTKSAFTWSRQHGCWNTGVDRRHFRDYLTIARLSPWPIWLLFLHLEGRAKDSPPTPLTGLLGNDIEKLALSIQHEWDGNAHDPAMVYWVPDALKKIAALEELQAVAAMP